MVSTPIFVGVADEVEILVARIVGHFAPEPRRRLDAFGLAGDFHLGNDQPFVVAVEDVDFPGPAAESFAISGLLDQWTFAQQIKHGRRIGYWNGVFKLQPSDAAHQAIDCQITLLPGDPDTDHPLLDGREIALPVKHARRRRLPVLEPDKILAFDFLWRGRLLRKALCRDAIQPQGALKAERIAGVGAASRRRGA